MRTASEVLLHPLDESNGRQWAGAPVARRRQSAASACLNEDAGNGSDLTDRRRPPSPGRWKFPSRAPPIPRWWRSVSCGIRPAGDMTCGAKSLNLPSKAMHLLEAHRRLTAQIRDRDGCLPGRRMRCRNDDQQFLFGQHLQINQIVLQRRADQRNRFRNWPAPQRDAR